MRYPLESFEGGYQMLARTFRVLRVVLGLACYGLRAIWGFGLQL